MPRVTETSRREAIDIVLARLGEDNLVMLKDSLKAVYKIDLQLDDLFTLEELQIALQRILGANGASLLIREIHSELRKLAAE